MTTGVDLPEAGAHPRTAQARMRAIFEAHVATIYQHALRMTFGERGAAEDLTQETMLRAWRSIGRLDTDVAAVRPWLLTVLRRVAIDAARARNARPAETGAVDVAAFPSPDDYIERLLVARTVREAVGRLTPKHRAALIEVYLRDRSVAEAAAVIGIPEGTVRSRLHNALRRMRTTVAG